MKKKSLFFVGFLQAFSLTIYCSLVGLLFWRGEKWFGPIKYYLGPVLFLVIFVVSALICGLLAFGYPVVLFWEKKKTSEALKLVGYTAAWLCFFILLIIFLLLSF